MLPGNRTARSRGIRENETPLSLPLADDSEERAVAEVYRKHAGYIKQNVELDERHLNKLLDDRVITQGEFDCLCKKSDSEALNELLQVLPRKGPNGFKVFVYDILFEDFRAVGELLDRKLYEERQTNKSGHSTSSESDLSPMSPNNSAASSTNFTMQSTLLRRHTSVPCMSQIIHTRSNEDLESKEDEHQHQINRIFSRLSTHINNRHSGTGLNQLYRQTPEPATLDKIEAHVNTLLKSIEECYKQFNLQPWNTSLKSSIIELKIERDKLYHRANDHTSTLETKLRNEKGKIEKLEEKVKKLEEFKAIFDEYTTAREIAEELRETRKEMEVVTVELRNTIDENKQLSRTVERTQTELDRYKTAIKRLEKENEELSLKLNTSTDFTSSDSQPSSLTVTNDNRPSTSKPYRPQKVKKNRKRKKHLAL
ncbi:uncharacterized protein LOC128205663 [Mya arenaria]|uniref:uncharacterized protein LOC128205663 n=1 Tax=Mya arenaria TaxID=6604 RepID=UPI0022E64A2E|nr:uncharacterized protein LOC128205663 [Mya arenaria]